MASPLPFDKAIEACAARGMTMLSGLLHEENAIVVKDLLSVLPASRANDHIWVSINKQNRFVKDSPTGILSMLRYFL